MSEPTTDERPIEHEAVTVEAAATARPVSRALLWAVCGVLIIAFLVVDFVTPQSLDLPRESEWLAALLDWSVHWPSESDCRLGFAVAGEHRRAAFVVPVVGDGDVVRPGVGHSAVARQPFGIDPYLGAILLCGVVVLQVPLWIAKKRFRWRLSRGADDAEQFLLEDRQFHLQHMLLAMFLWAVALSPLRTVLPPGNVGSFRLDAELFVTLGAVVVCNILVTIPCIWWAFVSTARLVPLVLGWLFYCAVLTAIEVAFLCGVLRMPPGGPVRIAAVFVALNVAQCVAVFGVLRIFRAMGFRLVRFPTATRR